MIGPPSPARALGWDFYGRHRWGFVALVAYLFALGAIRLSLLAGGDPIRLDTPESFAFAVVIPLTATFTYLLAVFSHGLSGDLVARQSMYPSRLFTLPVTSGALAGWPMSYGTITMIMLWLATRTLALWPTGIVVPTVWPALLAATLLAWTQAFMWMPYGLPGIRVIATFLWLGTIDSVVLLALHFRISEPAMVAFLAPQVPLAYIVARLAVARARHGEVPDWRAAKLRFAGSGDRGTSPGDGFPSPLRAQAWYEWRQHGRSLPVLVGMLLPFELALLPLAGDVASLVLLILLGVLVTPVLMAAFVAATVRGSGSRASDGYGMTSFLATKPLSDAAIVAAKLRVTVWSTLVTWGLILVAMPVALRLTGARPVVVERAHALSLAIGAPRSIVLVALVLTTFIVATWKLLVQSLYIGLTGRAWLIKGSVFVPLVLLFLVGPTFEWIASDNRVESALWDAIPLGLATLVFVKMSAAAWVFVRLQRTRLVRDGALLTGAASWCVATLALYGLLAWFLSTPFFPRYVLALVAILATPLARLSAAPLALAWNRHR
jgi:hypothetical protein